MQLKTDPLHEDAQAAEGRYGDDLSARLAEFDRDGTLVPDMRELWEILNDHVVDISRAIWEHYCQYPATRAQLSAAAVQGVIEGSSCYPASMRTEERREGTESASTCRSGGSPN